MCVHQSISSVCPSAYIIRVCLSAYDGPCVQDRPSAYDGLCVSVSLYRPCVSIRPYRPCVYQPISPSVHDRVESNKKKKKKKGRKKTLARHARQSLSRLCLSRWWGEGGGGGGGGFFSCFVCIGGIGSCAGDEWDEWDEWGEWERCIEYVLLLGPMIDDGREMKGEDRSSKCLLIMPPWFNFPRGTLKLDAPPVPLKDPLQMSSISQPPPSPTHLGPRPRPPSPLHLRPSEDDDDDRRETPTASGSLDWSKPYAVLRRSTSST